jgi:hypothetical protein
MGLGEYWNLYITEFGGWYGESQEQIAGKSNG